MKLFFFVIINKLDLGSEVSKGHVQLLNGCIDDKSGNDAANKIYFKNVSNFKVLIYMMLTVAWP